MKNAGLDHSQAGIEIAGRNINNLRYADDTTLKAESEEELKSLLIMFSPSYSSAILAPPPGLPFKCTRFLALQIHHHDDQPTIYRLWQI